MIGSAIIVLIAILIGGVLLFPIKFCIRFRGKKQDNLFELRLFRKRLFRYATESEEIAEKSEKENSELSKASSEPVEDSSEAEEKASKEDDFDAENPWKKDTVEAKAPSSEKKSEQVAPKSEATSNQSSEVKKTEEKPKQAKTKKPSKKKKSKHKDEKDSEFLTLLLESNFDKKVLSGMWKIFKSFFKVFHCRFERTVAEGIRFDDYKSMGYAAGALSFAQGAIPFLENWEFRMDWERTKPMSIEGEFIVSISLARTFGFLAGSSVWILKLFLMYRKNRKMYRANPESIRLIFWKRWIVRFLSKDK